jgi:hypothetical protein
MYVGIASWSAFMAAFVDANNFCLSVFSESNIVDVDTHEHVYKRYCSTIHSLFQDVQLWSHLKGPGSQSYQFIPLDCNAGRGLMCRDMQSTVLRAGVNP